MGSLGIYQNIYHLSLYSLIIRIIRIMRTAEGNLDNIFLIGG